MKGTSFSRQAHSRLALTIIVLLLSFGLTACEGMITGQVFIDTNNNGLRDPDEPSAGSVKVTVTQDGKRCTSGFTIPDGSLSIRSCGDGIHCINVDEDSTGRILSTSTSSTASSVGKQLFGERPPSSSGTGTPSPSTPSTTPSPPATTGTTTPQPAAAATTTAPANQPTSGSAGSQAPLPKNCKQVLAGGSAHFDIGLTKDFFATVRDLPKRALLSLSPGQDRNVTIPYPCDCQLLPFFLPETFEVGDVQGRRGPRFQANIGRVEFSASNPQSQQSPTATSSDVCVHEFPLRAKGDAPAEDATYSMKFKVRCPDGEHDLDPLSLKVAGSADVEVDTRIFGTPQLGQGLSMDVIVTNKNAVKIDGIRLSIAIPNLATLQAVAPANICEGLSNPVRCSFGFVPGETERIVHVRMQLPTAEQLTGETTFQFDARVTGIKRTAEDSVSFRLAPPRRN